jgi:signal peptidase II
MRRTTARIVLLLAVAMTIGCDHVTKRMAVESLAGEPARSFLSDTIRLDYAENAGGFLSLGADLPLPARIWFFTIGTGLLLLGTIGMAFWLRWTGARALGMALLVAGGASNWIDRVRHGYVVDFLNVGIGPVRTGIFNVADVAIMAGIAIILVTEAALHRAPPPSTTRMTGDAS